jgi:hypothetical protein
MTLADALIEIYTANDVYRQKPDNAMLHETCPDRLACWGDIERIKAHGCDWNTIQKPYIGKEYQRELLAIGLNLNEYGGWQSLDELFRGKEANLGVLKYSRDGRKKIFFASEGYAGTIVYHRLAVYSSLLLDSFSVNPGATADSTHQVDIFDDSEKLSEIMHRIAFIEAVKCSPWWYKSVPTDQMKSNCPKRFLYREIEILAPRIIIIFDKEIFSYMKASSTIVMKIEKPRMTYCKMRMNGLEYETYYMIHPATYGGNSQEIGTELYELRQQIGA